MDRCLKCNEENNKECTLEHKAMKEKDCVFADESQYDVEEIIRIHDLIFDDDINEERKIQVTFLDGTFGAGKTYKLNKVLKFHTIKKRELEINWFDSFQTGFSDNFMYILFLNLVSNNRLESYIRIWKNNFKNAHAHFLAIPFLITMSIILYNFIKVFDFTILNISINKMYTMMIIVLYAIVLLFLPYLLTIKKEYAIVNRKYYFNVVTALLGDVLIIDDLERLNEDQRRQIYEYIDYLRSEKSKKKLKIILVGNLKMIEAVESAESVGTNITTEPFISKYYNQRISMKSWTESFSDRYKIEIPNLNINPAEKQHITKFLNYISSIFSRREYLKFIESKKTTKIESFELSLIDYLKRYKNKHLINLLSTSFNEKIVLSLDTYENIDRLLQCKFPENQTIHIDNAIESDDNKIIANATLVEITSSLRGKDISHLEELIELLEKQKGNPKDKLNFFTTQKLVKKYKNTNFDLIDNGIYKYQFADNVEEFYNLNYLRIGERYVGDTILKELNNIEAEEEEETVLSKMVGNYSKGKREFLLDDYIEDTSDEYKHAQYHLKDSYTQEEFNEEIINLAKQYYNFKNKLIFNIINKYPSNFNLKEALNAYDIVHSRNSDMFIKKINKSTNIKLTIQFQIENKSNTKIFEERMALILLTAKKLEIIDAVFWSEFQYYDWFGDVNKAYEILDNITINDFIELRKKSNFFKLSYLTSTEANVKTTEFINLLVDNKTDETDVYDTVINDLYETMNDDEIKCLIMNNSRVTPINNDDFIKELSEENRSDLISKIEEECFSQINRNEYVHYFELLNNSIEYCWIDANPLLGKYMIDIVNKEVNLSNYPTSDEIVSIFQYIEQTDNYIEKTHEWETLLTKFYEFDEEHNEIINNIVSVGHNYDDLFKS